MMAITVWTVGHSTLGIDEFAALLRAHNVQLVADIRSLPGSRRYPHFDRETLSSLLHNRRLGYRYLKALGGRRRASKDSINLGWRHPSFRGYADYTLTKAFADGCDALMELAAKRRVAVMCAEAVYWRCHRNILADVLCVRGVEVRHILSNKSVRQHKLHDFAVVQDGMLSWPQIETQ